MDRRSKAAAKPSRKCYRESKLSRQGTQVRASLFLVRPTAICERVAVSARQSSNAGRRRPAGLNWRASAAAIYLYLLSSVIVHIGNRTVDEMNSEPLSITTIHHSFPSPVHYFTTWSYFLIVHLSMVYLSIYLSNYHPLITHIGISTRIYREIYLSISDSSHRRSEMNSEPLSITSTTLFHHSIYHLSIYRRLINNSDQARTLHITSAMHRYHLSYLYLSIYPLIASHAHRHKHRRMRFRAIVLHHPPLFPSLSTISITPGNFSIIYLSIFYLSIYL
ncbi:unnamed protein product [Acanthosepion pharaonis]|uniref:Uncharacterized protein n=1 Tax=Acanthosepion pharaonis TaxID=158019 RepID=A0A812DGF3_ACAPH|nr:unnamed protein product [Sepia pharaonis]